MGGGVGEVAANKPWKDLYAKLKVKGDLLVDQFGKAILRFKHHSDCDK